MKRTFIFSTLLVVFISSLFFINGCKLFFSLEVKTVKDAEDSEKNKTDSDHVDIKDDGKTQFITSETDFMKLNRFHVDLSKLNNLSDKQLYSVQVNRGENRKYETGYIVPVSDKKRIAKDFGKTTDCFQCNIKFKTPDFVYKFNSDPEKYIKENLSFSRVISGGTLNSTDGKTDSINYEPGSIRNFKVAKNMDDTLNSGTPKKGKLVETGKNCLIYVAIDEDFKDETKDGSFFQYEPDDLISEKKIKSLAKSFDDLYPYITSVMGSSKLTEPIKYKTSSVNYGYTVSDNNSTCPEKIIIFINDIFNDKKDGDVLGYFWAADLLPDNYFSNSNGCKMFYLDSYYLMKDQIDGTKLCDSTLAHEFTHMLNVLNKKTLSMDTWFTEMLAMSCEDIVSGVKNSSGEPILDFNTSTSSSVFVSRLPYFNVLYGNGFSSEVWSDFSKLSSAYSNTYAFGAYLIRNYGGIKLLNQIAVNSSLGVEAINDALEVCGYNYENFYSVLSKFGQVLINLDSISYTSSKISLNKGTTEKFNDYKYLIFPINLNSYYVTDSDTGENFIGPLLKETKYRYSIGGWGMEIKMFGTLSKYKLFDAQLPTNESCDLYVYMK